MVKWWLLSDEDAHNIAEALRAIMDDGRNDSVTRTAAKCALLALDSGLNETDAVPEDWREIKEPKP